MAKSRSFGGITPAVWSCVKSTSFNEHGTVYNPADGNVGTSTTSTIVGEVLLSFNYDSVKDTVSYNILKKPFLVSDDQIWSGIQDTIDHCS
jgi:hypothetical protein